MVNISPNTYLSIYQGSKTFSANAKTPGVYISEGILIDFPLICPDETFRSRSAVRLSWCQTERRFVYVRTH